MVSTLKSQQLQQYSFTMVRKLEHEKYACKTLKIL